MFPIRQGLTNHLKGGVETTDGLDNDIHVGVVDHVEWIIADARRGIDVFKLKATRRDSHNIYGTANTARDFITGVLQKIVATATYSAETADSDFYRGRVDGIG